MTWSTPRGRGQFLRQAINKAIRENFITYTQVSDGYWKATIEHYDDQDVVETENTRTIYNIIEIEFYFIPNEIQYGKCPIYCGGYHFHVDWKTYCWSVRKLSEYQIIQKMSE